MPNFSICTPWIRDLVEASADFCFATPLLPLLTSGVGGQQDITIDEPDFGALIDTMVLVGTVAESRWQRSTGSILASVGGSRIERQASEVVILQRLLQG